MMVGEIRDLETAEIAVQASLTGHLVLYRPCIPIPRAAPLRDYATWASRPYLLSSSLDWRTRATPGTRARRQPPRFRIHRVATTNAKCWAWTLPIRPTLYKPAAVVTAVLPAVPVFTNSLPLTTRCASMIHDGVSEQELERHARLASDRIFAPMVVVEYLLAAPRRSTKCCASLAKTRFDEMGAFEYVAMDQGRQAAPKGLLEGDTPKHIRQLLARSQTTAGQCYRGRPQRSTTGSAAFRFARALSSG